MSKTDKRNAAHNQPEVQPDDEVTVLSRKVLDRRIYPEILAIDGRGWLNLGAGLLAELAAEIITKQYPDAEVMTYAFDEILVHLPAAAATNYESLRIVIMVKVE